MSSVAPEFGIPQNTEVGSTLETALALEELQAQFRELLRPLFASAQDYELSSSRLSIEIIEARSKAIEAIYQSLAALQVTNSQTDEAWCLPHTNDYGQFVNQLAAVATRATAPVSDALRPKYNRFFDEQRAALQIRQYIEFLKEKFDSLTALGQRIEKFQTLSPDMQTRLLFDLYDLIQHGLVGHLREATLHQLPLSSAEQKAAAPTFAPANIRDFAQLLKPYVTEQLKCATLGAVAELSVDAQPTISTYALTALCKLLRDNGAVITFQDIESGIVIIDYTNLTGTLQSVLLGLPSQLMPGIGLTEKKMQLLLTGTARNELTTVILALIKTLGN